MSCFDALNKQLGTCEECRINAFIVEFEELPEEEKYNFDWYEKEKHFLIYCEQCKVFKILPEPFDPDFQ